MVKTLDLRLASFLIARGNPHLSTETDGGRLIFIVDEPESVVCPLYSPDDLISANRLFESSRSLRSVSVGVR